MSTTLTPVITQAGITALVDAKNRGMLARITYVAVGDGVAGDGSGPYTATDDMTALRHEVQRAIVSGGEHIGSLQNQLHLTATLQDEGTDVPDVYPIYEIGFFLETGELFAIYASPDEKLAEKVAGTDFLLAFDLTFTGAEAGDVVIDGSGALETPAARDNILLGANTIKIHTQAEFDAVFNQGTDIGKAVEAVEIHVVVNKGQLADLVLHHNVVGLAQGCVGASRDDLCGHDFGNFDVLIAGKLNIGRGQNADELASFNYRHSADFVIVNQLGRKLDVIIGTHRDRVFNHQIIKGDITQHGRNQTLF